MAVADNLNWDDLRYFLRVAQARTLAGAARSLGVDHSTIGRRLTALERAIGASLVLRGPEGITLTPLGEKLAPLAQNLERDVAALLELSAGQTERVRLAVPSGFTQFLTPRIARLREQYPRLTLELHSGARLADLKRGDADLALRVGRVSQEDLVARKLGDVGWSLYASASYLKRHPPHADPTNLRGHEIIGCGPGFASEAAKWIAEHAAQATIVLHSNDSSGMLEAAVAGLGLAVLPCYQGDAEPALIRLTPTVLTTRDLSLVYRREARLSEAVRVVNRFVVDTMREHADCLSGKTAQAAPDGLTT
jgi:DNA-binding transcriptional LysR family regulator